MASSTLNSGKFEPRTVSLPRFPLLDSALRYLTYEILSYCRPIPSFLAVLTYLLPPIISECKSAFNQCSLVCDAHR